MSIVLPSRHPEVLIQQVGVGVNFSGVDPLVVDPLTDVVDQYRGRVLKYVEGSQGGRWVSPESAGLTLIRFGHTGTGATEVAVYLEEADELSGVHAYGSIQCVGSASLVDGETVTISDGLKAVIFEFDTDARVAAGNTAVSLNRSQPSHSYQMSPVVVAQTLKAAIEKSGLNLNVIIDPSKGSRILLENRSVGVVGNVPITDTVVDAGFVATGMANGVNPVLPGTRYLILSATALTLDPEAFEYDFGHYGVLIPPGWKLVVVSTGVTTTVSSLRAVFGRGWAHDMYQIEVNGVKP